MLIPEDVRNLLREWEKRCGRNIDTHAWADRSLDRWNGVTAVVSIGSLVALGASAGSFDLTQGRNRYWLVVITVIGALASVMLTVRDFGSKASAHRSASRQYGALRRQLEQLAAADLPTRADFESRLADIGQRWDWVADTAPNASKRIRRKAEKRNYEDHFI